jgi:hypothetical protein
MIKKLLVIGPGHSVSAQVDLIKEKRSEYKVLAFQGAYPHCETMYGIVPDLWYASDPNGLVEGLEHILKTREEKDIEIFIPSYFEGEVSEYRRYGGTSPIIRKRNGWSELQTYLKDVNSFCSVIRVRTTSTKFIKTISRNPDLRNNIFGPNAYYRFMHDEMIIGSVPFDSESVVGNKFKWGLENKLSAAVLPLCYYLGAEDLYILGFDMYGPRFYSSDTRHPWNDETQATDATAFPLSLIKQWTEWEIYHGMSIYSASDPSETLLSKILPTKKV